MPSATPPAPWPSTDEARGMRVAQTDTTTTPVAPVTASQMRLFAALLEGPARANQPLTAPAVRPRTKNLCKEKKTTMGRIIVTKAPAVSRYQD